jgi:hypothetical protein
MLITDYHVENVLRTYSRQLQKSKLNRQPFKEEQPAQAERVTISEEAKQKLLMDRIKSQALEQVPVSGLERED